MAGVWYVLLNRAADSKNRWPKSVHQCVLQPHQFSSFNPTDPNSGKFPDMKDTAGWRAFQDCLNVVWSPVGGDPTNGANHYENCEPDQLPLWADSTKLTATIGPFRFYKL